MMQDLYRQIDARVDQMKRERAGIARRNLLEVLYVEMENIPEAKLILERYIRAHSTVRRLAT